MLLIVQLKPPLGIINLQHQPFLVLILIARIVAHKVQLHLDWYVGMNMYINTVYTCYIRNAACN
jgi:hypothetical protein